MFYLRWMEHKSMLLMIQDARLEKTQCFIGQGIERAVTESRNDLSPFSETYHEFSGPMASFKVTVS